ncbi:Uncharacterised protein [Mycobacteroides abscessus subsp. abscessus]|uniref:hypothetical protein n=1 Tax=Mycobacteroides abscessus TaxID=36809 RepID=UPI0009290568|nr:hypothetical protein [Mycobacteroides abscessus]SHU25451.1 Uncharacterised protein [Mycobacteroides abscessus subsp. abscessus]
MSLNRITIDWCTNAVGAALAAPAPISVSKAVAFGEILAGARIDQPYTVFGLDARLHPEGRR